MLELKAIDDKGIKRHVLGAKRSKQRQKKRIFKSQKKGVHMTEDQTAWSIRL
jgi:hypothetical protein